MNLCGHESLILASKKIRRSIIFQIDDTPPPLHPSPLGWASRQIYWQELTLQYNWAEIGLAILPKQRKHRGQISAYHMGSEGSDDEATEAHACTQINHSLAPQPRS